MICAVDYATAFGRNRGFISEDDQNRLKKACVGVAGLGGIGGAQLLCLARLGISRFHLADLDIYELTNMNRQLGATVNSIGRTKTEVSKEIVRGVNLEAEVSLIEEGITPETIDDFLESVDMVVDAIDFNCFQERFLLYRETRKRNLRVINAAPAGFGSSLMLFNPEGMSFEAYFDLHEGMSGEEKAFALAYGVTPSPTIIKYLDLEHVDLKKGALPCVSPGFFVSAGVTATEVIRILLNRKGVLEVPWVLQFDAMLHCYHKKYYPPGMRHPWQKFLKKMDTSID